MMFRIKQRIIVGFLALFFVWPLLHRAMVLRYDVCPWRFFGWAMYCMPKLRMGIEINLIDGDERKPLKMKRLVAERVRLKIRSYLDRRRMLGKLAPPDVVAREVFKRVPRADAIEIVVHHPRLDPKTSCIVERTFSYEYFRDRPAQTAPAEVDGRAE